MFEHTSTQAMLFLLLYGGAAVTALILCLYLALGRSNAIAPAVTPPARLRRWAAALFAIAALGHTQTRPFKEINSQKILNSPKGFVNILTQEHYTVEAYAAVQEDEGNRLIIRGKIFVRVDEVNRVDVLKQCSWLKGYVKDPARSQTSNNYIGFARVPDHEIKALRAILEMADGAVEYSEMPFGIKDTIKITKGILSKSEALKGMRGTIEMINGQKQATVILDKLGVFKFILPVSQLRKTL